MDGMMSRRGLWLYSRVCNTFRWIDTGARGWMCCWWPRRNNDSLILSHSFSLKLMGDFNKGTEAYSYRRRKLSLPIYYILHYILYSVYCILYTNRQWYYIEIKCVCASEPTCSPLHPDSLFNDQYIMNMIHANVLFQSSSFSFQFIPQNCF